jgi:hypothetical protein
MKFAVMLICVFFINAPGQTAQNTNSDHIFYDNYFINTQPEADLLSHDHRGTKQFDYFDKVVSWIKDTYRSRVAKDNYGPTRLLLLSFGVVGLVGIRRKFRKSRSAQNPAEK